MSPITVERLEIAPLPHPAGASAGLNAVIDAVEKHIDRSILLLASGDPGSAPDFTLWLDRRKLPGERDLDRPENRSDVVEKYTDRQQEVKDLTAELDRRNNAINDSQVAAFGTSNRAYENITDVVRDLRGRLEDAPAPTEGPDHVYRLSAAAEITLLLALVNAADRVHEEVVTAVDGIDTQARDIQGSAPAVPRGYDHNNGGMPAATNPYQPPQASAASYRITDPKEEPVDKMLALARGEVGTSETSDAFAEKPYNNGSAWCASFTSWLWNEAGYDVSWTDFDYVPAVWNDAAAMGLQARAAQAQPGDLIVFDWEGDGTPDHIGVVDSVNGGTIHTIEGNSSDRVQRMQYGMNSGNIVGIVKQPPTGTDQRM